MGGFFQPPAACQQAIPAPRRMEGVPAPRDRDGGMWGSTVSPAASPASRGEGRAPHPTQLSPLPHASCVPAAPAGPGTPGGTAGSNLSVHQAHP